VRAWELRYASCYSVLVPQKQDSLKLSANLFRRCTVGPTTITSGFGSGSFYNDGTNGITGDNAEHDGWVSIPRTLLIKQIAWTPPSLQIVCEWYHGINAPQLFQMIKASDDPSTDIPATCFTSSPDSTMDIKRHRSSIPRLFVVFLWKTSSTGAAPMSI